MQQMIWALGNLKASEDSRMVYDLSKEMAQKNHFKLDLGSEQNPQKTSKMVYALSVLEPSENPALSAKLCEMLRRGIDTYTNSEVSNMLYALGKELAQKKKKDE